MKNLGFLHNMLSPPYRVTGPQWVNDIYSQHHNSKIQAFMVLRFPFRSLGSAPEYFQYRVWFHLNSVNPNLKLFAKSIISSILRTFYKWTHVKDLIKLLAWATPKIWGSNINKISVAQLADGPLKIDKFCNFLEYLTVFTEAGAIFI